MHVAVAVGAVLDLAALELADGLGDVGGHRAGLGVGHEAAGTEHPAELPTMGIMVGGGDGHVEVEHAALDLGGEVVGADEVGAGLTGGSGGLAGGEHGDADVLAGAGGQGDGAAHHLVGLAGIDAEPDDQLDGLVELGRGQALAPGPSASAMPCSRLGVERLGRVGLLLALAP